MVINLLIDKGSEIYNVVGEQFITYTDYVGRRRRIFESICLFVCLFVRSITQKTNDPKVFKLGIGNQLRIP